MRSVLIGLLMLMAGDAWAQGCRPTGYIFANAPGEPADTVRVAWARMWLNGNGDLLFQPQNKYTQQQLAAGMIGKSVCPTTCTIAEPDTFNSFFLQVFFGYSDLATFSFTPAAGWFIALIRTNNSSTFSSGQPITPMNCCGGKMAAIEVNASPSVTSTLLTWQRTNPTGVPPVFKIGRVTGVCNPTERECHFQSNDFSLGHCGTGWGWTVNQSIFPANYVLDYWYRVEGTLGCTE